jgi:hypothetical protein
VNMYLLERWPIGTAQTGEIGLMVITARRADAARKIASRHAGPEGAGAWLDAQRSTCKIVDPNRTAVVARAVQS